MSNSTHSDPSTNGSGVSRPEDPADIFSDLAALRLSPDEAGQIGTAEVLAHVPVRKPGVSEFVRVSPHPEMSIATSIFLDPEREVYLVMPALRNILVAGVKPMMLVTAINQRGQVLLWPIALGDSTGRRNVWHETAREAAELAKTEWVKVVADMPSGCYRIYPALGALPDPVWPDSPLSELLRLAFRNRIVDCEDHPVVKQSLGLIP